MVGTAHVGIGGQVVTWPGDPPDVIEYGRAALAGLGHISGDRARELHILRLRSVFDRAGLALSLRYVLRVLTLMREVQELKSGYWFPTPVRFVPLERGAILVAPIPTGELQRHFDGVSRAGYARFVPQIPASELPRQTLRDWAGLDVLDTRLWTRDLFRQASETMAPTLEPQNVEFFSLKRYARENGKRNIPTWVRDFRLSIYIDKKVVLCRNRLAENYYRHFWGQIEQGKVIAETALLGDVHRVQHGIAALADRPITVELAKDGRNWLIRTFALLPRPERRILLALAKRTTLGPAKTYRLEVEGLVQPIVETLERLGCGVETVHG